MKRIPEPELMDEAEQARAYAESDFSEPHDHFVELFRQTFQTNLHHEELSGFVLDLGCGAVDVSIRFAKSFPQIIIHGLDGAEAMLECAHESVKANDLTHRIELYQGLIQSAELPLENYDVIISNSLLHHMLEPEDLWQAVKRYGQKGCKIFVMDLMRQDSVTEAKQMTEKYAANEPEILQRDFYNSLCAAFTLDEVVEQLENASLDFLSATKISDRHLLIKGIFE